MQKPLLLSNVEFNSVITLISNEIINEIGFSFTKKPELKSVIIVPNEDKTLYYYLIKLLHYQNQLTYYIYLNNSRATMQRREANFWRIAQIPSLILTIISLYFLFTNLIWGVLLVLLIAVVGLFGGYKIYNYHIKKENERDVKALEFTTLIMALEYLVEQIDLIERYNFSKDLVDPIDLKLDTLEYYIEQEFKEIWENYLQKACKEDIIAFLNTINYDVNEFYLRLNQYQELLRKYNRKGSTSYDILNKMITKIENDFPESLEYLIRNKIKYDWYEKVKGLEKIDIERFLQNIKFEKSEFYIRLKHCRELLSDQSETEEYQILNEMIEKILNIFPELKK